MTDPNDTSASRGEPSDLETYIRLNRRGVTEDVLRRQALAAGHSREAVEAALAATRSAGDPVDRGRVTRNLFVMYLAVYLILDGLILINPANNRGSGFLGDVRGIGILVLSMALGAAFVASLIWVTSRRRFIGLVGIGIAVMSLTTVASALGADAPGAILIPIAGVGVGAALAFAAARVGRSGPPPSPSAELLMVVPILLLLAVGGSCVLSGLPIPRPA
jgi:hypothetical protein